MGVIDSNTKLLLPMNGADESTVFTDDGNTGHTMTANGNAQIDTAESVFDGASGLFDGTGDYIDTPDHADWAMGSGDFTIDFRFKRNGIGTTQRLTGQNVSPFNNADTSFVIGFNSDNKLYFKVFDGTTEYSVNTTATFSAGAFIHGACIRDGNTLRIHIAGVQDGTLDVTGVTLNDIAGKLAIGRPGEQDANYYNGWLDEFRISKGVARWTNGDTFTPPIKSYGSETITPSVVPISVSVLTPADVTDNTMLPSALAITASLLTPTSIGAFITVTPSAQSISASVLAPVIGISPVVSPSALAIATAVLAPTVVIDNIMTLEATLPALTLEARIPTSLNLEATLPTLTLEASCKTGQLLTMTGNLPVLTLVSHMGMHMVANLPALTLSSALTVGGVMSLTRTLPALTLEASMTSGRILILTANLAALTLSANLVNGNILTLAQTLPALTLEASGTTGNNMSLSGDLPVLTLVSAASSSENLTLTATLPALKLEAFMDNYLQRYI